MLKTQSTVNYKKWIKLNLAALVVATSTATYADLDPNIVNAPFQVVIPTGIGVITQEISPNASDASIVFRITALSSNAWYDAIAPYHPTAIGVYSDIPNRPEEERTDYNRNVAMLYASLRVLNSMLPKYTSVWREMLTNVDLDPDNESTDLTSPIGIGNVAGTAIAEARANDGMNQLGNENGCKYNCTPYEDYTGYIPKNTAESLTHPSHWQPNIVTSGNGLFKIQKFVTPQLSVTKPYTFNNPSKYKAPYPRKSNVNNYNAYTNQVDKVLQVSANLTDEQKAKAELFDHKFNSVLAAAGSVVTNLNLSLEEAVFIEFATNIASFDTAIAIWHNKKRYDAVRPFSAISYIHGDQPVTAWGGPGIGTVNDIPANQWESYLPVADHPEYPSATASFCSAHAQVMRKLYGENNLSFSVDVPSGSSRIEPGITPSVDLTLSWNNWKDFENDCGKSRLWGGVHFPAAIKEGKKIGRKIANRTIRYLSNLLKGHRI